MCITVRIKYKLESISLLFLWLKTPCKIAHSYTQILDMNLLYWTNQVIVFISMYQVAFAPTLSSACTTAGSPSTSPDLFKGSRPIQVQYLLHWCWTGMKWMLLERYPLQIGFRRFHCGISISKIIIVKKRESVRVCHDLGISKKSLSTCQNQIVKSYD